MTLSRTLSRLDLSLATWQARAVRYVLIYLLLALALVAARFLTQDVRPDLRAVQQQEATLTNERDELEVLVQRLNNPQRIRDWAAQHGLRPFAEAPKKNESLRSVPAPAPVPARTTLEVYTEWK